ncbi:hypothetical protein M422DRAFT_245577 [Sphaerobolus stellatus SS14]|nr:hypothetical protein M422DRAFT_245577 [Sphaerobolus stellatus SS14]
MTHRSSLVGIFPFPPREYGRHGPRGQCIDYVYKVIEKSPLLVIGACLTVDVAAALSTKAIVKLNTARRLIFLPTRLRNFNEGSINVNAIHQSSTTQPIRLDRLTGTRAALTAIGGRASHVAPLIRSSELAIQDMQLMDYDCGDMDHAFNDLPLDALHSIRVLNIERINVNSLMINVIRLLQRRQDLEVLAINCPIKSGCPVLLSVLSQMQSLRTLC